MTSLTGRGVMQKRPRIENRRLLDLAHTAPCFAAFPHDCDAHLGCHPAHSNWLEHGKGVGKKTSDWLVAFVCKTAHDMLDGRLGGLPKEQRQYFWLESFISTGDYIWSQRLVRVA